MILIESSVILLLLVGILAAAIYETYGAFLIVTALVSAFLYYFGWFTFAGIMSNLPTILVWSGSYLAIGVIYSFFEHWRNMRKFGKFLEEIYKDYIKSSGRNDGLSFRDYYYKRTSSSERFNVKIDFDTLEISNNYLDRDLPFIILFWWSKFIKRLLKGIFEDLIQFIIRSFKGIYQYITYLTINNTMKKISELRVDTSKET